MTVLAQANGCMMQELVSSLYPVPRCLNPVVVDPEP